MYKIKSEQGSMTVYVTIVLLTMLIIISTIFMVTVAKNKEQIQVSLKVKEAYEVDNAKAADIYASLTGVSEPEYITDGLILHYDAINNTGDGHSNTATTWKDLSGNGNDGTLSRTPGTSNFYWEENNITIEGYGGALQYYVDTPLQLTGQERTYIYVVDASNLSGAIFGETDNDNDYGLLNYHTFVSNRAGRSSDTTKYEYTFTKNGIYCYAISLSSSQLKFYENGKLVGSINNTKGLNCNSSLRLLAGRYSSQNATNLKMYNFMAYDRVLSDSEIQTTFDINMKKYGITT